MKKLYNRLYIANQALTPEVDEIRWLITAFSAKKNIALEGEPGNGKSSAIRFAAQLIEKPAFSRTCHEHEQTFHYEGRPQISNGSSSYSMTQFQRALKQGGIFINEESSDMPPTIQKYLSVLLSDDRLDHVMLDSEGNEMTLRELQDKHGWNPSEFIYTETFNPARTTSGRDNFAMSHKSRMNPFVFNDLDSILAAHIAFARIGIEYGIPLRERGVVQSEDESSWIFTEKDGAGAWTAITDDAETYTSEYLVENNHTYSFFDAETVKDTSVRDSLITRIKEIGTFYHDYLTFLSAVRNAVNPDSYEDSFKHISEALNQAGSIAEPLSIVYPDQRFVQDGFEMYNSFSSLGERAAAHATTQSMISKMLHGALRSRKIVNSSQQSILQTYAVEAGLLPREPDATSE